MDAFQRAIDLGYTYLETDVHVTADGVVVAFHDDDLLRTTGRRGRISELPWSEVSAALVDGRAPIPRLDDLLAAWPHARLNIDCKSDGAVGPLTEVLQRADALDRCCVASFSDRRLVQLRRRLGPQACTALGPADLAALRYVRWRPRTALVAQVPPTVTIRGRRVRVVDAALIRRAHRAGVAVHVWTIDDAEEIRTLLDLGVDGVMTDRPGVLRDVLVQRGEWA